MKSHQYTVIQHQGIHFQTSVSIIWCLVESRLDTGSMNVWVLLYFLCCFLVTKENIFDSIPYWIAFNLCENIVALVRPDLVYSKSQSIIVISSLYSRKCLEDISRGVSTVWVIKAKPKHSLSKMLGTAFPKYSGR